MNVNCPSCGTEVFDAGNMYLCERGDQCPGGFKVWATIAGYTVTEEDIAAICEGKPGEEREFTSKAGKPFKATMTWDFDERKVAFKFREERKAVEGVLCPDHGVELRASEKRYYCPTKIEEGVWCQVGAWRTYGSHNLTPEELGELLVGVPVGPWEMKKRDGTGTYQVMAEFDFDENTVVTSFVDAPKAESQSRKGGLGL